MKGSQDLISSAFPVEQALPSDTGEAREVSQKLAPATRARIGRGRERESLHRSTIHEPASDSRRLSKSFLLAIPVIWSRSWPSLKKSSVGIARML